MSSEPINVDTLTDVLRLLEQFPQDIAEISKLVDKLPLDIFHYKATPCISLYRARYYENFDITNPEEFSYIHSAKKIPLARYNKKGVPALYTSTHYNYAYHEIEKSSQTGTDVFVSKWKPIQNKELSIACNLSRNGSEKSIVRKYYNILISKFQGDVLTYFNRLGNLLEWPADVNTPENQYNITSEMASRILSSHDVLMTVSTKADELNLTFNKDAADSKLKLESVFWAEAPSKHKNTISCVKKIGVPDAANSNIIVWHDFEIDEDTLRCPDQPLYLARRLKTLYKNEGSERFFICPIVKDIDDFHTGLYKDDDQSIRFECKIKLSEIS